jgi:hypothetical protein
MKVIAKLETQSFLVKLYQKSNGKILIYFLCQNVERSLEFSQKSEYVKFCTNNYKFPCKKLNTIQSTSILAFLRKYC